MHEKVKNSVREIKPQTKIIKNSHDETLFTYYANLYMPLHKKGSLVDSNNYLTITLTTHARKILLHMINSHLKAFVLPEIPDEQVGFMLGNGIREILNTR